MAPPLKKINEQEVEDMASQGMTHEEIAAKIGISPDTLTKRCTDLIKRGHLRRNGSLRSRLFAMAMNGNIAAAIWLSKQHLGYSEKVEQSGEVTVKEALDAGKRFIGRVNGRANGNPVSTEGLSESS